MSKISVIITIVLVVAGVVVGYLIGASSNKPIEPTLGNLPQQQDSETQGATQQQTEPTTPDQPQEPTQPTAPEQQLQVQQNQTTQGQQPQPQQQGQTSAQIFLTGVGVHSDMSQSCSDGIGTVNTTVTFPQTQAVLTATLNEMLQFDPDAQGMDEQVANYFKASQGYTLDSVTVSNGVATVNISNNTSHVNQQCRPEFAELQIDKTAKQFSTVQSTDIYLNGSLIQ